MAASVKIEFDDGSRVMSETLDGGIDGSGGGGGGVESGGLSRNIYGRPVSCPLDDFYEASGLSHKPFHGSTLLA